MNTHFSYQWHSVLLNQVMFAPAWDYIIHHPALTVGSTASDLEDALTSLAEHMRAILVERPSRNIQVTNPFLRDMWSRRDPF